ncbi:MAG: hypothetical protein ACRCTW_05525, partial [Lactococcus garvieae]
LPQVKSHQDWIKSHFAAVGLSSSRPVMDSKNKENGPRSRRVTFRVITNAEIQMKKILEQQG